jgi:sugar lactone lactonase YvrE/DNA-binding IclR family transcriptional regulator
MELDRDDTDEEANIPGAQALLRGLDVLMAIGMSARPMRFREIQEEVGLPKGTLHRLLSALQQRRIVRYDDRTRRYHVGSRVFDLARRTIDQSSLIRATKPEIVRLARILSRPVCLYVPDGSDLFVLDFEDPDAAQSRMVRVWPRARMTNSAAGQSMLAAMPPEDRQQYMDGSELDLGMTQALGYAIGADQNVEKRHAIATAVLDEAGYPVAAICCMLDVGPDRAEQLHEIGRLVREGGLRASGNLPAGYAPDALAAAPVPATRQIVNLGTGRDYVGENPIWLGDRNALAWLDVLAPALRLLDLDTGNVQRIPLPEITGGLARDSQGEFVLLGQKGVFRFDPESGSHNLLLHPEAGSPDNRFNSAAVAPDGSLWAGTMAINHAPGKGHLYKIGHDLSVIRTDAKLGLAKNAAWSPDGTLLYIGDGASGAVMVYECDLPTARLGPGKPLIQGASDKGVPNGIAVDSEGCIWVAMLGGWTINRYTPDGRMLESVALPTPMPINLCFGGKDLRSLFVTSSYLRLPPGFSTIAPASGNVFRVEVDVPGLPMPRFGEQLNQ